MASLEEKSSVPAEVTASNEAQGTSKSDEASTKAASAQEAQQPEANAAQEAGEDEMVAEDILPITLSVHFPERPLLPANAAAQGLPDTPDPLQVPMTGAETLNDLRVTLCDNTEGYWLGAFCFRRPVSEDGAASKKDGKVKLGEALPEFVEFKTLFEDDPSEEKTVYISHVHFTEHDARQHVLRLREIFLGSTQDPVSTGVDAGISVADAIRNKEAWLKETGPQQLDAPKGPKNQKKGQQQQAEVKAESPAQDTPENPFAGWEGWKESPSSALIPEQARRPRHSPSCLRHISVASWSPPPQHWRTRGHYFYLHIVTLENETVYITASSEGFFINECTSAQFNPVPRHGAASYASCTLFDMLFAISPLFLANFAKFFQDPLSSRDLLAALPITNCLPAYPWLVRKHSQAADPVRTQLAYLLTGTVSPDTLEGTRDWNEELQSTRELPRTHYPDRVLRDKLLNRTYADFVATAVRAVPKVAAGEVQAMNPMDKPDAQMFVCNNLFISKGVDGVDLYPHMGGDEAAYVAVGKDVAGIRTLNTLDVQGLCLLGTAVVDWKGERWVAQSIVPGLFRKHDDPEEEEEQQEKVEGEAAQGEAESKKEVALEDKKDEKAGSRLRQLAEETAVVYGGVDGPEIIRTDASMHKAFKSIAEALHLAEHKVEDAEGKEHTLWSSVDCKGLRGADGRRYALDLARLNPLDIEWLEKDFSGPAVNSEDKVEDYPHKLALLRPELLEHYWDTKFRAWVREEVDKKEKEAKEKAAGEGADTDVAAAAEARKVNPDDFKLSFNPDSFVEFKLSLAEGEEEGALQTKVIVKDESDPSVAAVRAASRYLREVAIPRLVTDAAAGLLQAMDGPALAKHMHLRGINVRYLGYVAQLCEPSQKEKLDQNILSKADPGYTVYLDTLRYSCLREMALRGSKRILKQYLKASRPDEQAPIVSHFLNCLFGFERNSAPAAVYHTSPLAISNEAPAWTRLDPASLREQIAGEVAKRYRFQLPQDFLEKTLLKRQALRQFCLQIGIQLELREYTFEQVAAVNGHASNGHASNGHANGPAHSSEDSAAEDSTAPVTVTKTQKKKRKAAAKLAANNDAVTSNTTFRPDDIINLVPVVKESTPRSALPDEALDAGRTSLQRGERDIGVELMIEGVQFCEQIYGLIHPEVSRAYATYASVIHQHASMLMFDTQQRKRVAQAEGKEPEDPGLSQFVTENLTFENALRFQRQAVTVAERTIGLDSQETLFGWINMSIMERMTGNIDAALLSLQRSLELWEIIHGKDHPECVQSLLQVGQALQSIPESGQADSLKVFQTAYELTRKLFGTDSVHTAQAAHTMGEAHTLLSDLKAGVTFMKEAYSIFEARLGKEDERTKESEQFLSMLTAAAVRQAKADQSALKRREEIQARLQQGVPTRRAAAGGHSSALRASTAPHQLSASAARSAAGPPIPTTSTSSISTAEAERLASLPVDQIVKYIQGESSKSSGSGTKKTSASRGGKDGSSKSRRLRR